ncbi:MAG: hypothetical protein ACK5JF_02700 [Oscillospiraceae bacterium]
MMQCPICGAEGSAVHGWVHCPAVQDTVCMLHCYSPRCEYRPDTGVSYQPCRYQQIAWEQKLKAREAEGMLPTLPPEILNWGK